MFMFVPWFGVLIVLMVLSVMLWLILLVMCSCP